MNQHGGMLPSRKEVERCHLIFNALQRERGITTGMGTSLGHFDDEVYCGRTRQAPKEDGLFLFKESKTHHLLADHLHASTSWGSIQASQDPWVTLIWACCAMSLKKWRPASARAVLLLRTVGDSAESQRLEDSAHTAVRGQCIHNG